MSKADSMTSTRTSSSGMNSDKDLDDRLNAMLSSSDFSVASYLNLALHQEKDVQQRMAELALQLQLQTQSCHEDIGRIGAELQAIMPRCAADVGRIGVGLEGMRIDAATTLSACQGSGENSEVSSSMETLSTLHALQTNLNKTKDILEAAASWDSTLASIPPMLAQSNLVEAVEALSKLESGERALRGMDRGKDERRASIAKVRNQVQVMLQPQLLHALQNMHTRLSPLQQCVGLYTKLGKMDSLENEYVKNRPQAIHKLWFSYTPSKPVGVSDPVTTPEQQQQPPDFVMWLPSWYDAVLELVTEERRQSLAVFGPILAPSMMVKVLGECFRPILASFSKRLESLSSPSGSQDGGSFESVCAIYEATLQFLSLSYEAIAGSWLDVSEKATASGGADGSSSSRRTALSLYSDVMAVFIQIASPFAVYQERFAELERIHSNVAHGLVAKDVQQAVSAVSMSSLGSLQDATERLKGLTPFVFPLAQGALARFELLNGGHLATEALSTIDGLLSAHAGELSVAIRTLSASTDGLVDNFDEQHVHVALEVLKEVAGRFFQNFAEFEAKSRDRLVVLGERMAAHEAHETQLQQASSGSTRSRSSFLFPDSLSVVEIDSLLTSSACGGSVDSNNSLTALQQLVDASAEMFPKAHDATKRLASSCHGFVFDVCFAVPRHYLGPMSTMSAWKEAKETDQLESYGTLPQQYITLVGENILALVQALEPFASDEESLATANQVMEGLQKVALQPWREFVTAAGCSADADNVVESLMIGKDLLPFVVGNQNNEEEEIDEEEEEDSPSTVFCNAWLDVVGLAVTGRLLERIMRISILTEKGCDHLAADLTYLANVLAALGVSGHPHALIHHLCELATLDPVQLKATIASRDRNHPIQAVLYAAEVRLALMRGISEK